MNKISGEDVLAFRHQNFTRNNVVVTSNGLSADELSEVVNKTLGYFSPDQKVRAQATYVGGEAKAKADLDGLSHVAVAFPVPAGFSSDAYSLLQLVLESKFTNQSNGILKPFLTKYSSGGLFGFYILGQTADANNLVQTAITELKAVAKGVNVDAAKRKFTLNNELALDGDNVNSLLLNNIVYNASSANQFSDNSFLTASAVGQAASNALKSNPTIAVLGKTSGIITLDGLKKLMV